MVDSIQKLMLGEHNALGVLLDKFEKNLEKDIEEAKKAFNRLKWILERHFFIEEKAIFIFLHNEKGDEVANIFQLMQEHGTLLEFMNEIDERLEDNGIPDISKFKGLLLAHRTFENDVFYPRLDEELGIEQKAEILEKILKTLKNE